MRHKPVGTTHAIARSLAKPIVLGKFTLTATALEVKGRPSFEEYQGVGDVIKRMHRASGFWLADWLRYGEERGDWNDRLSQAHDATGLSEKTLKNVRAVAAIEPSRRHERVEFSLHAEVAGLAPKEQNYWLEKAEAEGWTVRELRLNIRAKRRPRIIEGQALLSGMYRVFYADPPWQYNSASGADSGAFRTAAEHYPTMSMTELMRLPVAAHALPDSVLFCWVTAPMLYENPGPRDVIEAWGFKPKTGIVWDKVRHNFGHYVAIHHEHLIIATRGSCLPDAPTPMPDSVQTIRRGDVHSEKPEEFRSLITKLYTHGPYCELFARKKTPGWTTFGNDARLWAEEAAS